MLNAKILEKEVELRTQKGRDYKLSDPEVVQVIGSYAKQRHQSIESYRQGGREDLAQSEEQELEIVSSYLPKQLDESQIEEMVRQAIAETGASSAKDMGGVMKSVMAKAQGSADGKVVNAVVRRLLSA